MRISDWSSDVCSSDLSCSWGAPPAEVRRDSEPRSRGSHLYQIARQPSATALGQDVHWNSAARGSRGTRMSQESIRSEEHTSELQSLMRISYAVFCLKKNHEYITVTNSPSTPTYYKNSPILLTHQSHSSTNT